MRATVSATRLAIEPPLTSSPLACAGKPSISLNQSITCASTRGPAWSPPPICGFIPAASISASIPSGVPGPITQPQKRGWLLPMLYGTTVRRNAS